MPATEKNNAGKGTKQEDITDSHVVTRGAYIAVQIKPPSARTQSRLHIAMKTVSAQPHGKQVQRDVRESHILLVPHQPPTSRDTRAQDRPATRSALPPEQGLTTLQCRRTHPDQCRRKLPKGQSSWLFPADPSTTSRQR